MTDKHIAKVRTSNTGQKTVTIPRSHDIKGGDWVTVEILKV